MRRSLLVFASSAFAICAGVESAPAQTPIPNTPYLIQRRPAIYTPVSGGTVLIPPGAMLGRLAEITLPFAFRFYDASHATVTVSSYGVVILGFVDFVSIGNQEPGINPIFDNLNNYIAPFWDGVRVDAGGAITYKLEGRAPSRVAVIEFDDLNVCCTAVGPGMAFQVRLHEGTVGRIQVRYREPLNALGTLSGSMGMEDEVGMRAIHFDPAPIPCGVSCGHVQLAALAGTEIDLVQDLGVDLAPRDLDFPRVAYFGIPARIDATVANLHSRLLGPFRFAIDASETPHFANPIRLYTSELLNYPPYAAFTTALQVSAPVLNEGLYYVSLTADVENTVREVDEANNVLVAAGRVRFLAPVPDLVVDRVRLDRFAARAGDVVQLSARLANGGPLPVVNGAVSVVLSSNPAITPQDSELLRRSFTLAPGQTTTATFSVPIATTINSGAYFLGVFADPDGAFDELSEANNGLTTPQPIVITGGDLVITTTRLPHAVAGESYLAILNAVGGESIDRFWEIESGRLPAGLSLEGPSGEIFGRPSSAASETFTVRVTAGASSATQELALSVVDPGAPLAIVSRALPPGVMGHEYAFQLAGTGGEEGSTLSWTASGLPDGVSTSSTGLLAGIPHEAGTSTVTVMLTDGSSSVSRELRLVVAGSGRLLIDPVALPDANFREPYRFQLTSIGGVPPIRWFIRSGVLPSGMTLSSTGAISGTPQAVGRFLITVRAQDAAQRALFDENSFELEVLDEGDFQIETRALPGAIRGEPYDVTITTSNGVPPFVWKISRGRLPEALSGETAPQLSTYRIRGTPDTVEVTNLLFEVVDGTGRRARRAFALDVKEPPPPPPPPVIEETGCDCSASRGTASSAFLLVFLAIFGQRARRSGSTPSRSMCTLARCCSSRCSSLRLRRWSSAAANAWRTKLSRCE